MSAANASVSSSSLDAERRAHEPSMEEILASIRRIIADDEGTAPERSENAEGPRAAAEQASAEEWDEAEPEQEPPAPSIGREMDAYPAPVLDPHDWRRPEPRFKTHPAADQALELLEAIETDQPSEQEEVCAEVAAVVLDEPSDEPTADEPSFDDASHPPETEDRAADYRHYAAAADDRAVDAEAVEFIDAEPFVEPEPEQEAAPGAPLVSPDAAAAIAAQFQTLAATMVINDSGLLHRYAQEMLRPMLKQWLDDNLPMIVERLVRSEIERVARGGRR